MEFDKINEFMNYYKKYYGSEYRSGQGLDEITDMINKYSLPGSWIDLGGGTSSFIWLPAFNKVTDVYSVDKFWESAYVQDKMRMEEPSGCCLHILNRYKKTVKEMERISITYLQKDLFGELIPELKGRNVSQFGLLGLCRTKDEYLSQLDKITSFMNEDSVFFGANWKFSGDYAKKQGFSNDYLNKNIIEKYMNFKKRELLYCEEVSIKNDPCYVSVLIYTFK